jgi:uncharacterized protein YhbP (UPF0306 family)
LNNIEESIKAYVGQANIMQLGTSENDQPWICTLHFYSDADLNFYWCSTTDRRHSKELAHNSKAACYVLVHENTPEEDYVIGISVEGKAELVHGGEVAAAVKGYVEKLGKDEATLQSILSGKKPFYRLKAEQIVLFNNKDFPENPRQVIRLN